MIPTPTTTPPLPGLDRPEVDYGCLPRPVRRLIASQKMWPNPKRPGKMIGREKILLIATALVDLSGGNYSYCPTIKELMGEACCCEHSVRGALAWLGQTEWFDVESVPPTPENPSGRRVTFLWMRRTAMGGGRARSSPPPRGVPAPRSENLARPPLRTPGAPPPAGAIEEPARQDVKSPEEKGVNAFVPHSGTPTPEPDPPRPAAPPPPAEIGPAAERAKELVRRIESRGFRFELLPGDRFRAVHPDHDDFPTLYAGEVKELKGTILALLRSRGAPAVEPAPAAPTAQAASQGPSRGVPGPLPAPLGGPGAFERALAGLSSAASPAVGYDRIEIPALAGLVADRRDPAAAEALARRLVAELRDEHSIAYHRRNCADLLAGVLPIAAIVEAWGRASRVKGNDFAKKCRFFAARIRDYRRLQPPGGARKTAGRAP